MPARNRNVVEFVPPTFVKLSKIISDRDVEMSDVHTDTDEPGENENQRRPQMVTAPVTIAVALIRCFYPRKNNRPGTRLTFNDGGGFAVSESYDDVLAMLGLSPTVSN